MLVGPEGPDCVLHIQRVEGVDGSEVQTPSTLTQYKNTSMEPPLGATPGRAPSALCFQAGRDLFLPEPAFPLMYNDGPGA